MPDDDKQQTSAEVEAEIRRRLAKVEAAKKRKAEKKRPEETDQQRHKRIMETPAAWDILS